jgi:hypothetical protein
MTIHPSLTLARIAAMCEERQTTLSDPGACTACGASADGVEPDAEDYDCEVCGEAAVCGCEHLMITIS